MADRSKDHAVEKQVLWTFKITGGSPFSFQLSGNPPVDHPGGVTVAHLVVTKAEAGLVKLRGAESGCKVKAWPMDGQTEEQAEERARFMELGRQEPRWESVECPTCPWFDPMSGKTVGEGPAVFGLSPCGRVHLPAESQAVLRETSELHAQAEQECPVR